MKPQYLNDLKSGLIDDKEKILAAYEMKQQFIEQETHKQRKRKDSKKTYPMCMDYYEPYNIAIFGLVSKEIQIHQLKQTGVKKTFFHIQSLRVEHMIVSMTVEE